MNATEKFASGWRPVLKKLRGQILHWIVITEGAAGNKVAGAKALSPDVVVAELKRKFPSRFSSDQFQIWDVPGRNPNSSSHTDRSI